MPTHGYLTKVILQVIQCILFIPQKIGLCLALLFQLAICLYLVLVLSFCGLNKGDMSKLFRLLAKLSLLAAIFFAVVMFREGHKYADLWLCLFSTNLIEIHAGKIYLFLILAFLFAVLGDKYESNK